MIDQRCLSGFNPSFFETVEDSLNQIVISGGALRIDHLLRCVILRNQIGESAADIDGYGVGHSNAPVWILVQSVWFDSRKLLREELFPDLWIRHSRMLLS